MLTPRSRAAALASMTFTRRDLGRFMVGAVLLVASLTTIFALDLLPQRLDLEVGDVPAADIVAPRTGSYVSTIQTQQRRDEASKAVEPVYDYSSEKAIRIATLQLSSFEAKVAPVDNAFAVGVKEDARKAILAAAVSGLDDAARTTLEGLTSDRWKAVRAEASRVLDATERAELRDTDVANVKVGLSGQMAGGLDAKERMLAAQIIEPLIVANSSFSQELTDQARAKAAEAIPSVVVNYAQNETIVRRGQKVTDVNIEAIDQFSLRESRPDVARLGGWF